MNNLRVCGDSVAIKVSTETYFRHGAEEGSGERSGLLLVEALLSALTPFGFFSRRPTGQLRQKPHDTDPAFAANPTIKLAGLIMFAWPLQSFSLPRVDGA